MNDTVIVGWESIAAAIGRCSATARRLYLTKGLPVGFPGGHRATAYLSHLQAWTLGQDRKPNNSGGVGFKNLEAYRNSVKS